MLNFRFLAISFLAIEATCTVKAYAQKFNCKNDYKIVGKGLSIDDDHHIYMADSAGIQALIQAHSKEKLVVLVSSSSKCSYTPFAISYINQVVQAKLPVHCIFILGDKLRNCDQFAGFFSQLDTNVTRVVPAESFQPKGGDDRSRCDQLVKAVFPETANETIGTPKYYILQPETGKLLFHGFRGTTTRRDPVRDCLEGIK